jgi:hypothetical protein
MKNAVSWDVTSCGSCKDRRFGRTYCLHQQGENNPRSRNSVRSYWNATPRDSCMNRHFEGKHRSQMIKVIRSSETSVLTRATRRHITEDGFLKTIYLSMFLLWSVTSYVCG